MTTDESPTHLIGTTPGGAAGGELAEQHPATSARTADLVRKLTSLADRYEAALQDGDDIGAGDSRQRVALLRTTAASGRRLIRSLARPATGPMEREAPAADRGDALAERRAAQVSREQAGAARGTRQDRTHALVTRLAECAIVRQAQGILMERAGLTAQEAYEALTLAATGPLTLDGVADHVVRRGELPPSRPSPDLPASVVEHAGLGIVLLGLDGVAIQANPAFCRILGCREDDLLSRTFAEYTHPDDVEHDLAQFTQMLAGGVDVYRLEKRYLRHDGGVVWCALTMSAARSPEGELLFAVGIVEDITEQRQLRDELYQCKDQQVRDRGA